MPHQGRVEFDCLALGFSDQGCFISEAVDLEPVSRRLAWLAETGHGTPTLEQYVAAVATQANIEYQVTSTDTRSELYFGRVDGEMYLLVVDLAVYYCDT
jgi:hypothetical protein